MMPPWTLLETPIMAIKGHSQGRRNAPILIEVRSPMAERGGGTVVSGGGGVPLPRPVGRDAAGNRTGRRHTPSVSRGTGPVSARIPRFSAVVDTT